MKHRVRVLVLPTVASACSFIHSLLQSVTSVEVGPAVVLPIAHLPQVIDEFLVVSPTLNSALGQGTQVAPA